MGNDTYLHFTDGSSTSTSTSTSTSQLLIHLLSPSCRRTRNTNQSHLEPLTSHIMYVKILHMIPPRGLQSRGLSRKWYTAIPTLGV